MHYLTVLKRTYPFLLLGIISWIVGAPEFALFAIPGIVWVLRTQRTLLLYGTLTTASIYAFFTLIAWILFTDTGLAGIIFLLLCVALLPIMAVFAYHAYYAVHLPETQQWEWIVLIILTLGLSTLVLILGYLDKTQYSSLDADDLWSLLLPFGAAMSLVALQIYYSRS